MAELSKKERKKLEKEQRKQIEAHRKESYQAAKQSRKERKIAFKQSLKEMPRSERKEAKRKYKEELKQDQTFVNMGVMYSPRQIFAELRRVQWPSFGQLMSTSGLVIIFTVLFGFYFFLCELLANGLIRTIVGA